MYTIFYNPFRTVLILNMMTDVYQNEKLRKYLYMYGALNALIPIGILVIAVNVEMSYRLEFILEVRWL